jgi:hypothetical protein
VIPLPAQVEENKCLDIIRASSFEMTHEANLAQMTVPNKMFVDTFTPSM